MSQDFLNKKFSSILLNIFFAFFIKWFFFWILITLFVAYGVLIGPINYIRLQATGIQTSAYVTIPSHLLEGPKSSRTSFSISFKPKSPHDTFSINYQVHNKSYSTPVNFTTNNILYEPNESVTIKYDKNDHKKFIITKNDKYLFKKMFMSILGLVFLYFMTKGLHYFWKFRKFIKNLEKTAKENPQHTFNDSAAHTDRFKAYREKYLEEKKARRKLKRIKRR